MKSLTKSTKVQKRKKKHTMALNRQEKDHLFTVYELEQEGRSLSYTTSAGSMCTGDSIFLPSNTCP